MRPARWLSRLVHPVKPVSAAPRSLRMLLVAAFGLQLAWYAWSPVSHPQREPLPPAPPLPVLRLASLGEPAVLARAGTLWLQFFDQQPADSVPYRELDYARLRAWLSRWLELDPASDYPLLLAVRLYGQVADPARQRIMLDFVQAAFRERPAQRWRWLAEAALVAKHRLGDERLALDYARDLAEHTPSSVLPAWARDLRILLLENLGEYEAARVLIGGLLASGEITDTREIRFLERRLQALSGRRRGRHDAPRE